VWRALGSFSAPDGCADGMWCTACFCKLELSNARGSDGGEVICSLQERYTPPLQAVRRLTAVCVEML